MTPVQRPAESLDDLYALVSDNRPQQMRIDDLRLEYKQRLAETLTALSVKDQGGAAAEDRLMAGVRARSALMARIDRIASNVLEIEQGLRQRRAAELTKSALQRNSWV